MGGFHRAQEPVRGVRRPCRREAGGPKRHRGCATGRVDVSLPVSFCSLALPTLFGTTKHNDTCPLQVDQQLQGELPLCIRRRAAA